MAWAQIPGSGIYMPPLPNQYYFEYGVGYRSDMLIDATGEKIAFVGRVWNKDRTTKSIRTVGFRFGAVTKAGGSGLTVSLQDVNLGAGPPGQPDGTQDQTVAIANADAGFASNVWYQTGNLSADRSVVYGELVAVVIEYDGEGRQGSDSVVLACQNSSSDSIALQCCAPLYTAAWALTAVANLPNVILGFSDGTFGTLDGAMPSSAQGTLAYKQDTGTADEYALQFQVPFPCKVDGCWILISLVANTSDFSVLLSNAAGVLTGGTIEIDGNTVAGTWEYGPKLLLIPFDQEIELAKDTTYYLSVQPTQTTSNVIISYLNVNTAAHMQALPGGTAFVITSRLDGGAWAAPTTTRRPYMGIRISSLDDGVGGGGGGGLLTHPGMAGGMRG